MVLVVIISCSRGGGSRGLVDASSGPVVGPVDLYVVLQAR